MMIVTSKGREAEKVFKEVNRAGGQSGTTSEPARPAWVQIRIYPMKQRIHSRSFLELC
jgi:hypothetical protein